MRTAFAVSTELQLRAVADNLEAFGTEIAIISGTIYVDSSLIIPEMSRLDLITEDTPGLITRASDFNGSLFNVNGVLRLGEGWSGREGPVIQGLSPATATEPLIVVNQSGRLFMDIGTILRNNIVEGGNLSGGAVHLDGGHFEMYCGEISNNEAENGGGVYITGTTGTNEGFFMYGGIIRNNTARLDGGGVHVANRNFTMWDGIIQANRTLNGGAGGGVYVGEATSVRFNMNGGTINGNIADGSGGGVHVEFNTSGQFIKPEGGTIHGYPSNTAQSDGLGHAVYVSSNPPRIRDATAGPDVPLNSTSPDNWDD
jgi:hypothetical protein